MKHSLYRIFVTVAALGLAWTAEPRCEARGRPAPEILDALQRALADRKPALVVRMPFEFPELVDPRSVLPDISDYPPAELAALYHYSRNCVDEQSVEVGDPKLIKAEVWHRFLCDAEVALPPRFFDEEPWFHPGGSSFVALAASSGRARFGPEWLRGRVLRLHVLESDLLLEAGLGLDDERRMLHGLTTRSLRELVDREPLVIDARHVFLLATVHRETDPGVYRVYSRDRFEAARQAAVNQSSRWLVWIALTCGCVLLGVVLLQTVRRARFRRLLMHERARVLRTLAHEVRTPTASLKLVLEELRNDYDDLPPQAQKGVLALCDEVHRLERVIRESGRYLDAFREEPGQAYRRVTIESINVFVGEVLEPYHDRLTFEPLDADPGVVTDPYWFAVCIRNLVDNALTHGAPPVVVRLHADRRRLHLSVSDAGAARTRELRRGLRPFLRTRASPGFGLGLSIVADTVAGLQGKLTWSAGPTRFTLSLRRAP